LSQRIFFICDSQAIEAHKKGGIQIDRIAGMQKWAESIKNVQDERIKLVIVTANNHCVGFGPGIVNIFRNMLGLPDAKWEENGEGKEQ
jgi:hypothetical protein